jgi:hypothetical protein
MNGEDREPGEDSLRGCQGIFLGSLLSIGIWIILGGLCGLAWLVFR